MTEVLAEVALVALGAAAAAAEVYLLKCQVGTPEEGDAGFKNVFSGLGHLAVVAAGAGKKATAAQLSALEAHTLARACYQQICRMEAGPGPTANLSGLEAQIVAVGNRTGNLEGSLQQVLGQVNRILLGGPGAAGLITRVNALEAGGGALLGGMRGGHPPLPPPTAVAAATKEERCRSILQQFLNEARALPGLPEVLVRRALQRARRPDIPRKN